VAWSPLLLSNIHIGLSSRPTAAGACSARLAELARPRPASSSHVVALGRGDRGVGRLAVTRSGLAWYIVATQEVAESVPLSPIDHFIFYLRAWCFILALPLMAAGLAAAFMISALCWAIIS